MCELSLKSFVQSTEFISSASYQVDPRHSIMNNYPFYSFSLLHIS